MGRAAANAAWKTGVLWAAVTLACFGCAVHAPRMAEPEGVSPDVAEFPAPELPAIDEAHRDPVPVAVILNDPNHTQLQLLQVFSARLGRPYQVFNLAWRSPASIRQQLLRLAPAQAVALGSAAYAVAAPVPGIEVLHSGVLNPDSGTRGVDALPPFEAQLDYWLREVPEIERLGVIGGAAMQLRMTALAEACADRGIALEQRRVGSDKETLLAFRSMVPHIDGFVFLPDEQVLSPAVIQQVLSHGKRNDIQVLVYSPVMFSLGATLFLQPEPVAVAEVLIELLDHPHFPASDYRFGAADPIQNVTRMQIRSRLSRSGSTSTVTAATAIADRSGDD